MTNRRRQKRREKQKRKRLTVNSFSRDQLTFVVQKKDDPTDQLLVFFPKDTSVGVKPLRV